MREPFSLILCLLALCSVRVVADDASIGGIGGAIHLMHGRTSIRMVSEDVHIALPECAVVARFVFHNDGRAAVVKMGFPVSGWGDGHGPAYTYLEHFQSFVDGRPVRVRRIVPTRQDKEDQYDCWWVKTVPFARHQTRIVTVRYEGGSGGFSTGEYFFAYVLKSGASWKGPIGRARIVCDLHGLHSRLPGDGLSTIEPSGYRQANHRLAWDLHNFKPNKDVSVTWEPGCADIQVNNSRKLTRVYASNPPPETELQVAGLNPAARFPNLRRHFIYLPLRTTAALLGARIIPRQNGRVVRLRRGRDWVDVTVGSTRLADFKDNPLSSGPVDFNVAATLIRGAIVTEFEPLVLALGGDDGFASGNNRFAVTLPMPPSRERPRRMRRR